MPSSHRRRILRLQLSVNRKSTATRWMGMWTVGVHAGNVWSTTCTHLKASEGAEKSCRKRRRRRGQRVGKRRSRVRHTREPSHSARPFDQPSNRRINSFCRASDYCYERVNQFEKLIKQSKFVRHWQGSRSLPMQPERYSIWKARWGNLRAHISRYGEGVVMSCGICPSFSYFLEQRLGFILHPKDLWSSVTARQVLLDWAESLEIRNNFTSVRNRPDTGPHYYNLSCSWCLTSFGSATRARRCPDCSRLCVAPQRRGGRSKRKGRDRKPSPDFYVRV